MSVARIVQITDLHILADDSAKLVGVDTWQSLEQVIGDINTMSPMPALVIASGDLTDDGSITAYKRLKILLNRLLCPVYILGGNHDEIAVMNATLVGGNVFSQREESCENWKLLFVNSKAEDGSHGFVTSEALDQLDCRLQELNSQPVLLAMHHTPLKLCASPSCQFKNADELLKLIERYSNVRGLIAGHTHNDVVEHREKLIIMTTPSTMVQVTHNQTEASKSNAEFWGFHQADNSRHGYRVVDLHPDGEIHTETRWVSAL